VCARRQRALACVAVWNARIGQAAWHPGKRGWRVTKRCAPALGDSARRMLSPLARGPAVTPCPQQRTRNTGVVPAIDGAPAIVRPVGRCCDRGFVLIGKGACSGSRRQAATSASRSACARMRMRMLTEIQRVEVGEELRAQRALAHLAAGLSATRVRTPLGGVGGVLGVAPGPQQHARTPAPRCPCLAPGGQPGKRAGAAPMASRRCPFPLRDRAVALVTVFLFSFFFHLFPAP